MQRLKRHNTHMKKPTKTNKITSVLFIFTIFILGGCTTATSPGTPEEIVPATSSEIPANTPVSDQATPEGVPETAIETSPTETIFAQTNLQPDGNRVVKGQGNIPTLASIDIPLDGLPEWITAVPFGEGVLWAVVLDDGRVQAFIVQNGQVEPATIKPEQIPAGMPPLLGLANEQAEIILPDGDFSAQTHPVFISDTGDMAYIDPVGNLIIHKEDKTTTLSVNAQPDARILVDENGRLLLNSDPTDEYGHGIMGDALEAGSLTLVATQPTPEVIRVIPATTGYVFEGIAPIWADLDGDGTREIIVTRSNENQGAQIVVLNESGDLLATGPAIGQGGRWRHQLSVAPFGPDGELELADVLTPHIGGPTEFYQWQDDELVVVASVPGHTSHVIRSRNLDMNATGQFDDSGNMTLLLPTQDRTSLSGIQHKTNGADVAWTLPLMGKLATNIAAVSLENGSLAVGVGQDNNSLIIWQP